MLRGFFIGKRCSALAYQLDELSHVLKSASHLIQVVKMGTWGIHAFENDTALDWLYDFEVNDFRLIDRTLAGVAAMQAVDELDADEACEVLAAAECVAAAAGFPGPNLPDEVKDWVAANQPIRLRKEYVHMARTAVARVRAQSELKELWAETEEYGLWDTAVADLQSRLHKIEVNNGQHN